MRRLRPSHSLVSVRRHHFFSRARMLFLEPLEPRMMLAATTLPTSEFASKVIAFSSQYTSTSWGASQALGAPNVTSYSDSSKSWSPAVMNGSAQFVTVGYATPIYANAVAVYENYGNGYVSKVEVRNAGTGGFETVWSGVDPSKAGKLATFVVPFTARTYLVDAVRLTIDTNRNSGWEDVDAIELRSVGGTINNDAPTVATAATATSSTVVGLSTSLSVLGADDGGEGNLKYSWTATTLPSGATPSFSDNNTNTAKNTTVTFNQVGSYVFTATITDAGGLSATSSVNVTVNETLTSVTVTPSAPSVVANGTQQFAAAGLDQFGHPLASQPAFTWSATAGSITAAGLFTAPSAATTATVTASTGTVSGNATITVFVPGSLALKTPALASLVQTLDADGSISRQDMIQVFTTVASAGPVTTNEFADLKTILANALSLNMPGYVQVLAGDIVNGNAANAHYQGATLGNLAVGSSSLVMTKLVDKWVLGLDHPAANANGSFTYATAAGTLFVNGPSYTDVRQGEDGDCYFIASMGALALSNPSTITNMILANGDGTYTVRFYANGKADYVTVDSMLPVSSTGRLVYDGMGNMASNSSNELWLPLLEKAYAQWNETGKEGRNGTNTYSGIEGGWMSDVFNQALGGGASSIFTLNATAKQTVISSLAASKAVTIGTNMAGGFGLYGDHAYTIVGYNSTTDTFTLYNPWGSNQPGQLTWTQLQTACDGIAIASSVGTPGGTTTITLPVAPPPLSPDTETSGDRPDAVGNASVIVIAGSSSIASPAIGDVSPFGLSIGAQSGSTSMETPRAPAASPHTDVVSPMLSSMATVRKLSLTLSPEVVDELFRAAPIV
jgi:hypothetical protein